MKVLTFFNEKGGSGNTTLTALCADYFAYKLHEPVYCVDFDGPSFQLYNIRENDVGLLKSNLREKGAEPLKSNHVSAFARECASTTHPYGISKQLMPRDITQEYLQKLAQSMVKRISSSPGYLFLDFPGSLRPNDPAYYFITRGYIDLVVMPVDSDRQSQKAALSSFDILKENYKGDGSLNDRTVVLWNREATKERQGNRDWYSSANEYFKRLRIPVVEKRVRDILIARRDADTFGFIRNTLCWPENNIHKACGYLPLIFDEIKARVDGKWDKNKKIEIYGE